MKKTGIFQILCVLLIAAVVGLAIQNRKLSIRAGSADKVEASTEKGKDALENILTRRSVRQYVPGKMLEKAQFEQLIKAGMSAPTAVNKQPWEFVAVQDTAMLAKLSEVIPHGKMLPGSGGAIVVLCNMNETLDGEAKEMWVQDCSAATENILLAAHAMDLGAVWLGVYPIRERMQGVSRALGLPSHVLPLCVISIGYPDDNAQPKDKYKPEKIHWEVYGGAQK